MAYWALQANPSRYNILQAGIDFDEITWTANQYADQVQVGDEVLLWLSGPRSGGYAFGKVTSAPTKMPEDPRFASYWVGAGKDDDTQEKPRLRLRFTRRMYLYPLLRSQCMVDPVLSKMHIIRQASGTIFKITDEQWARVLQLVQGRSSAWKREETILALGLYFENKVSAPQARAAEIGKLARLLDRSTEEIEWRLDDFRSLEDGSSEDAGVGGDGRPIWDTLAGSPGVVRRLARDIQTTLLEGGGSDRVRIGNERQRGKAADVRVEQRKDAAFARERFELLLPDPAVRTACLTFLADAIERAHDRGEARWGVTLRISKKIHFNVGRCLGLGIYQGRIWLGLPEADLTLELRAFLDPRVEWLGPFKALPGVVKCQFHASLLGEVRPRIEDAYMRFLDAAARTAGQTPFFSSHSPGVLAYLRETLNRPSLPNPVYDTSMRGIDDPEEDDDEAGVFEGSTTTRRYWKVAPGRNAQFWNENLGVGLIAIGWGEAGDPRAYASKEELSAQLAKVFGYTESEAHANVRQVWAFTRDIKPGDIIVANRGQSKIVGRGTVLGPAEFRADRGEFANCLAVRWFDIEEREIPRQESWVTTVAEISPSLYATLFPPEPDATRASIYDHLRSRGLHFPAELVTTYLLSFRTKPFVILSGISGTGKTKLAQAVAEWAGSEEVRRHEFISVRPDWLDGKEVLGFYNVLTEAYALRPFLSLLLRAHRDRTEPHFVILDEMNLARVEHYFADLLSAMESRTLQENELRQEALHLHDQPRCLPMAKPETGKQPERCASCKATRDEIAACSLHFDGVQMVPPKLEVPANVYITGTVNIDETTHMFSPKVLDRANVIEFNEVDLPGYGQDGASSGFVLRDGRVPLGATTVARQEHFLRAPQKVRDTLVALNHMLAEENLHFGYRVANEMALYIEHAMAAIGPGAVEDALDLQVLQKLLPKLHGSKQKLLGPLFRILLFTLFGKDSDVPYGDLEFDRIERALRQNGAVAPPGGAEAQKPVMPRSAKKLARMLRKLRSQGFVSFIE
ncbi:EVE domain-containing protein [Polyangium jinanense]|uniref:EVE domain-containing protein n=1 Tax=Polyangium jinanense TaxID=2829994 RepID=A0A9X4AXJ9_9BACT|nr:EVE domain-containing protein [Polyangium jinanense]MDC3959014.1 EVE domain-containing protein [Polyangium jinanense]MDC3988489.1 EVE domain-containing protein [Polyangium jinanense]